jgi:FG-GAP repeat
MLRVPLRVLQAFPPFVRGLAAATLVLGACATHVDAQISEAELLGSGGVAVRGNRALVGRTLYQRHAGFWTIFDQFADREGLVLSSAVSLGDERIALSGSPVRMFRIGTDEVIYDGALADSAFDVSLDGDLVALGIPSEASAGVLSGAVRIWRRSASGWAPEALLVPNNAAQGAQFGYSVDLRGTRVLIGARADIGDGSGCGAAYVFDFDGSQWSESAKLTPVAGHLIDFFGWSVSLGTDRALIGAVGDDESAVNGGAAYVFERSATSGQWQQVKKLLASNAQNGDGFGSAVALAPQYAVIGAYSAKQHGFLSGAAWVYEREAGDWKQVGEIVQRHPGAGGEFGEDVAIDGFLALVGQDSTIGIGATAANLEQTGNALQVWPPSLSLSLGGQQLLSLNAGITGSDLRYWILGSASGTSPGIPLPAGWLLPLVEDAYLQFTLQTPNSPYLPESLGALSVIGQTQTVFTLPAGTDPALAGIAIHHAFVAFEPLTGLLHAVSNAAPVLLVP